MLVQTGKAADVQSLLFMHSKQKKNTLEKAFLNSFLKELKRH